VHTHIHTHTHTDTHTHAHTHTTHLRKSFMQGDGVILNVRLLGGGEVVLVLVRLNLRARARLKKVLERERHIQASPNVDPFQSAHMSENRHAHTHTHTHKHTDTRVSVKAQLHCVLLRAPFRLRTQVRQVRAHKC
jgi:hypothetical protein